MRIFITVKCLLRATWPVSKPVMIRKCFLLRPMAKRVSRLLGPWRKPAWVHRLVLISCFSSSPQLDANKSMDMGIVHRAVCLFTSTSLKPRVEPGHPSFPLVHLLHHLLAFLLFLFFHWLYLFSSFVHPFPF